MDKHTQLLALSSHISGLMARLEAHHKCCFYQISETHSAIESGVTRAFDSRNTARLLFYSNLIAKAVDALEVDHE